MSPYKVRRQDYPNYQEYSKAKKAWKEFTKSRSPKKPKKKKKPKKRNPPLTNSQIWWKKYNAYLKSDEWKHIREHIILIRGGRCERCYSTEVLQVHHKHYRNVFKERSEDLELLCRKCHQEEHRE